MKVEDKEPIPSYGDLMTIEEFKDTVDCGGFIDYDGYGHFATEDHTMGITKVYPSEVKEDFLEMCREHKITHICWFNR